MNIQEKINQLESELQDLKKQFEEEQNDPKQFLLEILGNELTIKIDRENYPNSVFYFKGETCLLELEKTSNSTYLWCNYGKIWNPISERFSLKYIGTQSLIKETVEEHFKLRDITPFRLSDISFKEVEEHFKENKK